MKIKNIISTLLALIIWVMVTGQTQGIQSQQPGLKNTSSAVKIYPTLVSSEDAGAVEVTTNTQNSPGIVNSNATRLQASELLNQANELLAGEQALRLQAKSKTCKEKLDLIAAANNLFKQAELKQIQASEISGKLNVEAFNANEVTFKSMLGKIKNDALGDQAISTNDEAIHTMKQAREMREEAYSWTNNTTKLGTLTNAEEKEHTALNIQAAAIYLLKKAIASTNPHYNNDLAVR